jgi:four helix bundle protein
MLDHRSLEAWQEARTVVLGALEVARVQLNIAEGYAYSDSPSFTRHLAIAYGSAIETGELLELALAAKVIPPDVGNELLTRNQRSQRLLLGLLKWRRRTGR